MATGPQEKKRFNLGRIAVRAKSEREREKCYFLFTTLWQYPRAQEEKSESSRTAATIISTTPQHTAVVVVVVSERERGMKKKNTG